MVSFSKSVKNELVTMTTLHFPQKGNQSEQIWDSHHVENSHFFSLFSLFSFSKFPATCQPCHSATSATTACYTWKYHVCSHSAVAATHHLCCFDCCIWFIYQDAHMKEIGWMITNGNNSHHCNNQKQAQMMGMLMGKGKWPKKQMWANLKSRWEEGSHKR